MTITFQERSPSHSFTTADDPRVAALSRLLEVALRLATEHDLTRILQIVTNGVCDAVDEHGFLPGRLDSNWTGQTAWSCLTGSSQIAHSLFVLATSLFNSGGAM